eukprot:12849556-Heterocapsa_arctica.AAC.1
MQVSAVENAPGPKGPGGYRSHRYSHLCQLGMLHSRLCGDIAAQRAQNASREILSTVKAKPKHHGIILRCPEVSPNKTEWIT